MKKFSRTLIDVDASADTHPALDAAVRVAAQCAATVKIVDVLEEFLPARVDIWARGSRPTSWRIVTSNWRRSPDGSPRSM